ncbi:MAG: PKD domain-containing protein [Bacteroidota bacterium]
MKIPFLRNLSVLLISLVMSQVSFAQWTTQTDTNTMVSISTTADVLSVGTAGGMTWVVFWCDVPAPQYYEVRAQLLDANGYPQFGPGGMIVDNSMPMSSYTTLWSIALGKEDEIYIGFNGTGAGAPAYVHKISLAGTQLWGSNGVIVGSGYDVKVLPLSNGEAVVFWSPGNLGLMQKYNATGTALWTAPVTINPAITGHKTSAGEMAELSSGDFVVAIHDRNGPSPSSQFYAQRYTTLGVPVWTAPIQLASQYGVFNKRYTMTQDLDTLYLGFTGSIGTDFQSFLQRINPDGTIPWGINGSDFSTQPGFFEMDTKAAYSPGSPYVWAICQYTNTGQSETGEYVQKFDKISGARQFSNNAKMVFPISLDMQSHKGDLQLIGDKPFFITSFGYNNSVSPISLVATLLDANGNFAWSDTSHNVATFPDNKFRYSFTKPVQNQSVCVWVETRPNIGQSRAFAQNILGTSCEAPVGGFTHTTSGLTVNFTTTALNADTVHWTFSDGTTASGAIVSHTFPSTGVFQVCQNVINACGSDTLCTTVTITAIGIAPLQDPAKFQIFPNPSHVGENLTIRLNEPLDFSFRILNLTGQTLYECPATRIDGDFKLSLSDLALKPGIYLFSYLLNEKSGMQKITVTR